MDVRVVPGDHYNIVEPPALETVGLHLTDALGSEPLGRTGARVVEGLRGGHREPAGGPALTAWAPSGCALI